MDKHHHWFDGFMAVAAWLVAHYNAPALIQILTIIVLIPRGILGIRDLIEWLRGQGK